MKLSEKKKRQCLFPQNLALKKKLSFDAQLFVLILCAWPNALCQVPCPGHSFFPFSPILDYSIYSHFPIDLGPVILFTLLPYPESGHAPFYPCLHFSNLLSGLFMQTPPPQRHFLNPHLKLSILDAIHTGTSELWQVPLVVEQTTGVSPASVLPHLRTHQPEDWLVSAAFLSAKYMELLEIASPENIWKVTPLHIPATCFWEEILFLAT